MNSSLSEYKTLDTSLVTDDEIDNMILDSMNKWNQTQNPNNLRSGTFNVFLMTNVMQKLREKYKVIIIPPEYVTEKIHPRIIEVLQSIKYGMPFVAD